MIDRRKDSDFKALWFLSSYHNIMTTTSTLPSIGVTKLSNASYATFLFQRHSFVTKITKPNHLLWFLLLLYHAIRLHWSDFWILFPLKSESLHLHGAQNGSIHRLVQFVEFAHSSQQKYRPSWYVKLPLHVQQAIPLLHAHQDRFFLSAQQCFPYIQRKRHYKNEKR